MSGWTPRIYKPRTSRTITTLLSEADLYQSGLTLRWRRRRTLLASEDFSTSCRRQKTLSVAISYRGSAGPLHLLVDSTAIKAKGEGEWNASRNGGPKRHLWRKTHIGIDEQTLGIRAVEVTKSSIGDAPMLPVFLGQIPPDQETSNVTADGACDTHRCYDAVVSRNASAVIPPSKNAKLWKPAMPWGWGVKRGCPIFEVPHTSPGSHRPDGPKANHALTFKLAHSSEAVHQFLSQNYAKGFLQRESVTNILKANRFIDNSGNTRICEGTLDGFRCRYRFLVLRRY